MNPYLLTSRAVLRAWLAPTVLLPGDVDQSPIGMAAAHRERYEQSIRALPQTVRSRAWWHRRPATPSVHSPTVVARLDR